MNRSLRVSLWAVAALVAACGGGGGDSGGGPPPPAPAPGPAPAPAPAPGTVAVNAAWRNFLTTSNSWQVSGTASNGNAYAITLSTAPNIGQVFPLTGTSFSTADANAVLSISNLGIHTSTSRSYYDPTTYIVAGTRSRVDSDPETCSLATASVAPPTSAAVGASGALQTFNDLDGCVLATSTQVGTSVTTWSLESDAGFNLFCLNTTMRNNSNAVLSTEGDCVEVAADGTLGPRARVILVQGMTTLTAKNY